VRKEVECRVHGVVLLPRKNFDAASGKGASDALSALSEFVRAGPAKKDQRRDSEILKP
jgi:hypothetical protein